MAIFKPAVTGLAELHDVLPDHELLPRSAHSPQTAEAVSPYRFGPARLTAPGGRARRHRDRAGRTCVAGAEAAAANADVLVVEGVGGLLVPLSSSYLVRDFAVELGLPLVIAARPGLGTINHTLMTIACARAVGLEVAAVVFTPWSRFPPAAERSNRRTIESLGEVETFGLPRVEIAYGVGPVRAIPAERWVGEPAGLEEKLQPIPET